MERVNQNSNLQKSNINRIVATPSLISGQKGVYIKPISPLNSFIKSNGIVDLENRTAGKYELKKFNIGTMHTEKKWLVLNYKIGKTKYKITSITTIQIPNRRIENKEGKIEITKGLWNTKIFKIGDLPKNIVDSINENINKFNEEWNDKVKKELDSKKKKVEDSKNKFFEELDM